MASLMMDPASKGHSTIDSILDALGRACVVRWRFLDAFDDAVTEIGEVLLRSRSEVDEMVNAIHGKRKPTPWQRALCRFAWVAWAKTCAEATRGAVAIEELPEGTPAVR